MCALQVRNWFRPAFNLLHRTTLPPYPQSPTYVRNEVFQRTALEKADAGQEGRRESSRQQAPHHVPLPLLRLSFLLSREETRGHLKIGASLSEAYARFRLVKGEEKMRM